MCKSAFRLVSIFLFVQEEQKFETQLETQLCILSKGTSSNMWI